MKIDFCSTCGGKSGYHALHCHDKPNHPSTPKPAPAPYVNDDCFLVFDVTKKKHMEEVWMMLPASYNGKRWRTA
jgi:hypothetical protein